MRLSQRKDQLKDIYYQIPRAGGEKMTEYKDMLQKQRDYFRTGETKNVGLPAAAASADGSLDQRERGGHHGGPEAGPSQVPL